MEFGQQVFDPVVTDRTHGSDKDARGHQDVVEDDPVQLGLLVKQLRAEAERSRYFIVKSHLETVTRLWKASYR